jgi:hypothetical protein
MSKVIVALILTLTAASPGDASQPRQTQESGIQTGAGLVQRRLFLDCADIGEVTDLRRGNIAGLEGELLLIGGLLGFLAVDPESAEIRLKVEFPRTVPEPLPNTVPMTRILDADGNGTLEFARLAAHWVGKTSLHAADGATKWIHPEGKHSKLAPTNTAVGDLDGDGRPEFVMCFNATDEVHVIEDDGTIKLSGEWGRSMDSAFIDVDGNGVLDFLYVDGEALWARSGSGEVLRQSVPPQGGYVNALHLVQGFGEPARDWLLVGNYVKADPEEKQHWQLVGLDAKTWGDETTWKLIELYIDAQPTLLGSGSDLRYAKTDVLKIQADPAGFKSTRLRLRLLDEDRKVLYDELIPPPTGDTVRSDGCTLVLPTLGDQSARLLVAYGTAVHEYTPPR